MILSDFVKKMPYLVRYVKHSEKLSTEAIVEAVLNNGDWEDVQGMLKIVGIQKAARIFRRQLRGVRQNYNPKIANYFDLYFRHYA
ncbi:MAG: hypothetical protein AAB348_01375 [Patescibacteria group bacterium]